MGWGTAEARHTSLSRRRLIEGSAAWFSSSSLRRPAPVRRPRVAVAWVVGVRRAAVDSLVLRRRARLGAQRLDGERDAREEAWREMANMCSPAACHKHDRAGRSQQRMSRLPSRHAQVVTDPPPTNQPTGEACKKEHASLTGAAARHEHDVELVDLQRDEARRFSSERFFLAFFASPPACRRKHATRRLLRAGRPKRRRGGSKRQRETEEISSPQHAPTCSQISSPSVPAPAMIAGSSYLWVRGGYMAVIRRLHGGCMAVAWR